MKPKIFSFGAVAAVFSLAACTNSSDSSNTKDTSTTTSTNTTVNAAPTTTTSSSNYAAMADTVESNSTKGYYLNPKTGKKYNSLKVDRTSGAITDDAGQPVWRYVDNRDWEVYGDNNMEDTVTTWGQVGKAKMEKDKLMYQGEGDKWSDYDTRWKTEDETIAKKWKSSDHGMKTKMTTEDGDKIKVKTNENGDTKIKVNGDKMKVDSNGNVKH